MKKLDHWNCESAVKQNNQISGKLALEFCIYVSAPTKKNFSKLADLIEELLKIQPFLEKPEYWNAQQIVGYKDEKQKCFFLCKNGLYYPSIDVVLPGHEFMLDYDKYEAQIFGNQEDAEKHKVPNYKQIVKAI